MPGEMRSVDEITRVVLVRHGRTEWNRVERFRGRADVPLDATGLAQADATGRRVAAEWPPVAIYCSPLGRAVATAEAIARHSEATVHPFPDLIDIDYGHWQGLTPDEARRKWPEMVDAWYHAPHTAHIPGGESLADVRRRGMAAVQTLARRHSGHTIALVGHTVINRAILLGVLGLGDDRFWRIRQEPCAINVFEIEADEYTLVSLNDTGHLRNESR